MNFFITKNKKELQEIKNNPMALQFASEKLKDNEKVVSEAVIKNPLALQFASEKLKDNRDVVRTAFLHNPKALQFASEKIKDDKAFISHAVLENPMAFQFASEELKDDKDVVSLAVGRDPMVLQFASEKPKNNVDIVLKAVKQNGMALQFASEEIKKNLVIVFKAVEQNGMALQYASEECKNDERIVRTAVKQDPMALQFASQRLVWEKLDKNPMALQYASENIKDDEDMVFLAVNKNPLALQFASEELKNNVVMVFLAVEKNGMALQYASEECKDDERIVLTAVKQDGRALQFASEKFKNNADMVSLAVNQDPLALQYASEECKNNVRIVLTAVKQDGRALQYVTTSSINLSGMKINDDTAKKLADGLQYNTSITSMDLSNNNITDVGMQSLIKVFSSGKNTTLKQLDIRDNKLTFLNYNKIRPNLKILTKTLEIPQIYFQVAELFEKNKSVEELRKCLYNYEQPKQQEKITKQQEQRKQQEKITKQQEQRKQEVSKFLETGLWEFFQENKEKYRDRYFNVSDPVFEKIFTNPPSRKKDDTEVQKLEKEYDHVKGILNKLNNIHEGVKQFVDVLDDPIEEELFIYKRDLHKIDERTINKVKKKSDYYTEKQALQNFNLTKDFSRVNDLIHVLNIFLRFNSFKKDTQFQESRIAVLQNKISNIKTAFKKKSYELRKVLKKLQQIIEQNPT